MCLHSVEAPHSNEFTATGMRVGHAPGGSPGHWGLTVMDAPLLALPDSQSCQQLSKARARRGVGLHSLDHPAVWRVLDWSCFISARLPGEAVEGEWEAKQK